MVIHFFSKEIKSANIVTRFFIDYTNIMSSLAPLTDPSLTIVITTSPLGLGHLRVTDALYHGLPSGAAPLLLGAQASSISGMYRFVSRHPFTRQIMEVVQAPPLDGLTAYVLRKQLRLQAKHLYQQLKIILNERFVVSKTVLLVASHPDHGHQLGAIKQKLAREMDINILLVVQVTDDSPQPAWYVQEADLISVPSPYTREKLINYAKKTKLPLVPIEVNAYPVSPLLTETLYEESLKKRYSQTDPHSQTTIHVTVPVSGAAVGLPFLSQYIQTTYTTSKRFTFHVVSRQASYTQAFLAEMTELPYVHVAASPHDRTTIDNYERIFTEEVISLEVTKPSEQAFKTLATPRQRGGAILLLAQPVGRQEYDNLHFLRNHGLMPHKHANQTLWHYAATNKSLQESEMLMQAHQWRALLLPEDAQEASKFTTWCLQEGLFAKMVHYKRAQEVIEVQSNGVEQFWVRVANLISHQSVQHQK